GNHFGRPCQQIGDGGNKGKRVIEIASLRLVPGLIPIECFAAVQGCAGAGFLPPAPGRPLTREMIMKQATIKRMIERDLLREREDKPDAAQCHACGRSYLSRPTPRDSDDSGRFCSVRCRETYDAGMPAYEPNYVRRITN